MNQSSTPIINYDKCTRCGSCIDLCPENSLELTDSGPVFKDPLTCTYCSICEEICPEGAIRVPYLVIWDSRK